MIDAKLRHFGSPLKMMTRRWTRYPSPFAVRRDAVWEALHFALVIGGNYFFRYSLNMLFVRTTEAIGVHMFYQNQDDRVKWGK